MGMYEPCAARSKNRFLALEQVLFCILARLHYLVSIWRWMRPGGLRGLQNRCGARRTSRVCSIHMHLRQKTQQGLPNRRVREAFFLARGLMQPALLGASILFGRERPLVAGHNRPVGARRTTRRQDDHEHEHLPAEEEAHKRTQRRVGQKQRNARLERTCGAYVLAKQRVSPQGTCRSGGQAGPYQCALSSSCRLSGSLKQNSCRMQPNDCMRQRR